MKSFCNLMSWFFKIWSPTRWPIFSGWSAKWLYHPLSICFWKPCLHLLSWHRGHHPVQRTELYSLGHPSPFLGCAQAAICWRTHSCFLPPFITGEPVVVDVGPFSFFWGGLWVILSKPRSSNRGEKPFAWKRGRNLHSISDGYGGIWSTEVSAQDEPSQ